MLFSSALLLDPLFKVQSEALRLCTDAMRSTRVIRLQYACCEMAQALITFLEIQGPSFKLP